MTALRRWWLQSADVDESQGMRHVAVSWRDMVASHHGGSDGHWTSVVSLY